MGLFELNKKQVSEVISILNEKYKKVTISNMAIEKAKNMIAKAVSKAEIKVYGSIDGKIVEVVDELYWRLNIMPNPNETGTDFWCRCIDKLIDEQRCLVIQLSKYFFIVESFSESEDVVKGRTYSNISITSGSKQYTLNKNFKAENVIDLRISNDQLKKHLKSFNDSIDELAGAAMNAYKKTHASKFKLRSSGAISLKDKDGNPITQNEYAQKLKENLNSDEVEMIMTASGLDIEEIKAAITSNASDVTTMIDQIYKATALAFDIPVNAFNGTISEKSDASNEFMTYCVDWFVELINDSFNAKCIGMEDYIKGERIKLDVSNFKHIDIIDSATNLDKLYQDGWSHNDILKLVKQMPIDEDWANVHHTTKNYEDVKNESKEGGE